MSVVSGSKVLIVEDEYFVATELQRFFTKLGATVLGPVPSIERAGKYVSQADAAILDVRLDGRLVFPLADELAHRQIPFVFYTGQNDISIPERFRYASYLSKPAEAEAICKALLSTRDAACGSKGPVDENVFSALPQLRLAARLHLSDATAADRLVELTLKEAIEHVQSKPANLPVKVWLGRLMEAVHRERGSKLLT